MLVVVDANELFSAIISPLGKTAELFLSSKIEIVSPKFILKELEKYKSLILKKSKLEENGFDLLVSLLSSKIKFFETEGFKEFLPKAINICPDEDDVEYFALALKLDCPIWSNDKALKKSPLKVLTTSEILDSF